MFALPCLCVIVLHSNKKKKLRCVQNICCADGGTGGDNREKQRGRVNCLTCIPLFCLRSLRRFGLVFGSEDNVRQDKRQQESGNHCYLSQLLLRPLCKQSGLEKIPLQHKSRAGLVALCYVYRSQCCSALVVFCPILE